MTKTEASRRNGAKSNGPATPEGRAIAAQNARKHGLTGAGPVVLPHESQQEYDRQLAGFLAEYKPEGMVELGLVHEIASTRWRLSRMLAMEAALFETAIEEQLEALGEEANIDAATTRAYAQLAETSKGFRLLVRYERELRRKYEKALRELEEIQEERATQSELDPESASEPEPDYSSLTALVASQLGGRGEAFIKAARPYMQKQLDVAAPPVWKSAA